MRPELTRQAQTTIEQLCENGCDAVNDILHKARNGAKIEQFDSLDDAEVTMVIDELAAIMAVYEQKD